MLPSSHTYKNISQKKSQMLIEERAQFLNKKKLIIYYKRCKFKKGNLLCL